MTQPTNRQMRDTFAFAKADETPGGHGICLKFACCYKKMPLPKGIILEGIRHCALVMDLQPP